MRKPRIAIWRETSILGENRVEFFLNSLLWEGVKYITGLQRTLQAAMRQQMGNTHGRQSCLQSGFISPFFLKGPLDLGPPGTALVFFFSNTLHSTRQFKCAEERNRLSRCFSLEFKTRCQRTRETGQR